ncbi:MAG: threonine--tRNA ligase [Thermoflavifilum sp.]|nr:threonine--tRNA ligase [Thermoflavifilum sp.]
MNTSIHITFPDGQVRNYPAGVTGLDIAGSISEQLAREVLAVKVNDQVWDATRPINQDAHIRLLTWKDPEGKATFWHSSAHLMAEALESLFPGVKFGIGPAIEQGFYYDVDLGGRQLSEEDLQKLEAKMTELARRKEVYVRKPISKAEAIRYYEQKGDPYKLELLEGLADGQITFYTQGNFTDLCRGPHIPHTGYIKAVKLTNVAGAYWRGDEHRPMLTRIYGISFPSQKELDDYLQWLEEAKKRDHRKIGKELELFTFSERVGMGLPLWLPNGTIIRQELQNFLYQAQLEQGYQFVVTPHIANKQLYIISGHYEKYGKDSFQPMKTPQADEEFMLKPMNCPHHIEIYRSAPRSYRDLPIRIAEFGTVYRYEQSGELHGLTRVRGFTQDDAHLFCRPDQVKEEFEKVIDLVLLVLNTLHFTDFTAQVSLRDQQDHSRYIGSEENWQQAEQAILEAVQEKQLPAVVEYGEAAFYGPKLDFMVKDALGRKWQMGTIQVDYNLPERFELEYVGADNQKHRPVMIHRAPFGSMERFVALLIEHCAGNFPLWLSPIQVSVLPITDKSLLYAQEIAAMAKKEGLRVHVDERNEKIGKKIRDAETRKIPYMWIVGEKEMQQQTVAQRRHLKGDQGSLALLEAISQLKQEIIEKRFE